MSATRSPVPLLYRHSSQEIKNLASVSSSLLPAFGTVIKDKHRQLKGHIIAPYDRRYRYVTRIWFTMDVASTLPFQTLYRIFTGKMHQGEVFSFLNLLRLWRLRRVSELFTRLEKDTRFSYFWTRCCKLICRDAINEILRYASKNRLPEGLKEQMLAHMQLKFRTAELQQEEVLEDLPKAIRSGIAQHLFRHTVENAYLFKGVTEDLIVQLVAEMKAEYFPPKVEIIQQMTVSKHYLSVMHSIQCMLNATYAIIW